jgi:hypothetical protein
MRQLRYYLPDGIDSIEVIRSLNSGCQPVAALLHNAAGDLITVREPLVTNVPLRVMVLPGVAFRRYQVAKRDRDVEPLVFTFERPRAFDELVSQLAAKIREASIASALDDVDHHAYGLMQRLIPLI